MPLRPTYLDPQYRRPPYSSPGVGGPSVLEQIAQWHYEAMGEIAVDNGCNQTLLVSREGDLEQTGDPIRDLTTICSITEYTEPGPSSVTHFRWRQGFGARIYVIAAEGDEASPVDAEDVRIARVIADIHLRLVSFEVLNPTQTDAGPRYANALAYDIEPLAWEIGRDPKFQATVISVPVLVSFEVLKSDPSGQ